MAAGGSSVGSVLSEGIEPLLWEDCTECEGDVSSVGVLLSLGLGCGGWDGPFGGLAKLSSLRFLGTGRG